MPPKQHEPMRTCVFCGLRGRKLDLVRVVAYDTRAEVVVPASRISSGVRQRVIQQLEGLRAGGDTCISCALDLGMRDLGGGNGNRAP